MAKSIRATLELVSPKAVESILKIDAEGLSSQPERFVQANLLGAYILINTWLMMIQQWSKYGWAHVLRLMTKNGLFDVIRTFSAAADQVVHGDPIDDALVRNLEKDIRTALPISGIPTDNEREFNSDPMAALLLVCRYPKRYSPLLADKLSRASIEDFVQTQTDLKKLQRQPFSCTVVQYTKEAIANMLDWDGLCKDLRRVDIADIIFTPGVSFDTKAPLLSKLQSIAKEHVEYFYQPFGIPLVASRGVEEPLYWGKYSQYEEHTVRLIAVPKNYKTARVIAPENVYRQALARRYFVLSDRYLPGQIKLHDQTQNQQYALRGSLDGSYATIDLHAASDRITSTHLLELFPAPFMDIMKGVLPTHYMYDGKKRRLESGATMGNSMTFWLESVLFFGVARAACDFYSLFSEEGEDLSGGITVYGDDIIVPTKAAATVVEWLEALGFIVNHDKSFWDLDHHYRESCGEEYYEGICVSSRYFPRFPIEGTLGSAFSRRTFRDGFNGTTVDTMASLVDLQHKMYSVCQGASELITEVIFESEKRMTTSSPDEGLLDVWSYISQPVEVPAPAAEIIGGKLRKIVVPGQTRLGHLTPITIYPKPEDSADEELVWLYNYANFLEHGPRYSDPLLELLGISDPPISYAEARSSGETKWVLVK